jgi:hypothetical protein
MTVNNFKAISELLVWDDPEQKEPSDTFYFAQLIKRKKENPEMGSDNVVIKDYFFKSEKNFLERQDEIIELCKITNARAYIHLNRRSFERVAKAAMLLLAEYVFKGDYHSARGVYTTACGRNHSAGKDKKWILDIDVMDEMFIQNVLKEINGLNPEGDKLIARLPTKNGVHLITKPFNLQNFSHLPAKNGKKPSDDEVDVHRNNPTNLYIP